MSVNNSLYCFPVMAYGTHEQKMKYLSPVAAGQKIGCYGLTEAGAGSDPAALRTSAVKDGNEWIINGEKKFITSGNVAAYAVIAAVTEKGKGYKGISSFVLDLENTPGFKVGNWESMHPAQLNWSSRTPGCLLTRFLAKKEKDSSRCSPPLMAAASALLPRR
jgi:alkylation response protein AidB-like acyl-CoA dehydrogenase